MCHSPVRKLYSTVSKSTTIPGRKIGLLMFVCHSRSVYTASERADDVSCLREQGVQRYANTYVDRQVEKTIKMLGPRFDWTNISWSYTFHRIYKY